MWWWCFIILRMEKFRVGYYIRIHGNHMMMIIMLCLLAAAVHCRAGRSRVLIVGVGETNGRPQQLLSHQLEEDQYVEGDYASTSSSNDDQFRRSRDCCYSHYCGHCSRRSRSRSSRVSAAAEEGSLDPLDPVNYNVDERLVPTGPDPLHN